MKGGGRGYLNDQILLQPFNFWPEPCLMWPRISKKLWMHNLMDVTSIIERDKFIFRQLGPGGGKWRLPRSQACGLSIYIWYMVQCIMYIGLPWRIEIKEKDHRMLQSQANHVSYESLAQQPSGDMKTIQ